MAIESVSEDDRLIIIGSGNLAWHVYKMAILLGYQVTVIDSREATLTAERFAAASQLLCGDVLNLLRGCSITETTSIVLVSHHHEYDLPALCEVVYSPARYIGALGNRRKVTAYLSALEGRGVKPEALAKVHVPIGLDIGGNRAAEIALSVMAEVQAVKYGRPGGFVIHQVRRGILDTDDLF